MELHIAQVRDSHFTEMYSQIRLTTIIKWWFRLLLHFLFEGIHLSRSWPLWLNNHNRCSPNSISLVTETLYRHHLHLVIVVIFWSGLISKMYLPFKTVYIYDQCQCCQYFTHGLNGSVKFHSIFYLNYCLTVTQTWALFIGGCTTTQVSRL